MSRRVQKRIEAAVAGGRTLVRLYAFLTAASADVIYDIVKTQRARKTHPKLPPPPPVEEWLPLYDQPIRVFNSIGAFSGWHRSSGFTPARVIVWGKQLDELPRSEREKTFEAIKVLPSEAKPKPPEKGQGFVETLYDQIRQFAFDDYQEDSVDVGEALKLPEIQFFFRIWIVSWVEYQQSPHDLMKLARKGDLDALTKLLRLDKAVVADPAIANEIHRAARHGQTARFRKLADSIGSGPPGPMAPKQVKLRLVALISQFSKMMGEPLNEPQIRAIFDSVALKHGKKSGKQRDSDLPLTSNALQTAIRRHNEKWLNKGQ
ncbi:hypothetical protein ACERK3_05495 [Phycisphaerales bacterium AB-hyl4]|uniref:Uncharacterized protein n=1 Tax=Natronomicrosphaera hydrolytica TaxID=3242702 RepID=A0ABV4U4T4_9BACT